MGRNGYTPEQRVSANQRYRAKRKEFLRAYKADSGCVDCGNDDPRVLDFDHLDPDRKTRNNTAPSRKGTGGTNFYTMGMEAVLAELEHCDVVCANCHRIRTVDRLGEAW